MKFSFIKRSALILILCMSLLTAYGCSYYPNAEQKAKAQEVIADWLAYKKQVENTQLFAKEENKTMQDTASKETEKVSEEEVAVQASVDGSGQSDAQTSVKNEQTAVQMEAHGYYYKCLSDSMRVVYDEIYQSFLTGKQTQLSTLSEEHADMAFQSVLYDHPEIFYVSGYHLTRKTMDGSTIGLSFVGQYDMTWEEIATYQKQIDTYAMTCLNLMPQGLDEYGKVKYVFDYIVTHTVYKLDSPHNQNICSVFIHGESVCQGYAEATQYLLLKAGIETTIVPGIVEDGSRHVWNLVKVNGAYYYMDTTWGDVDYRDTTGGANPEESAEPINYDYFLVTTEQLSKSHTLETILTMPACVSIQDNYYVREGLYFEGVDEERLARIFEEAYALNMQTVTVKCSSVDVFMQMKAFLVDEQNVFRFVNADEMISYSEDEQMCTLCFWL